MPTDPNRKCRHSAFTLAELMTVCACVGLLFSMAAVPTLKSLATGSKYAKCLERMQAIGQASLIYSATDVAESAIPVHRQMFDRYSYTPLFVGAYEWGGKSGVGSPNTSVGPNHPLYSRYGTRLGFGPATRPLNNILYPHGFVENFISSSNWNRAGSTIDMQLALDTYRCPADDGPPLAAHCRDWVITKGQTSFDFFGTSYAANMFMIQDVSSGYMSSNSPYLRSVSSVPNPQRTYTYEENVGRWAWATKRAVSGCEWVAVVDPGEKGTVRGWHGKDWTYNYVFVDGHAATTTMYRNGTEDYDGFAQHYITEELSSYPDLPECSQCPPGDGDCPGYEAEFQNYQCVIVRGDEWQKDTLPAKPVCTGRRYTSSGRPSFESCVSGD